MSRKMREVAVAVVMVLILAVQIPSGLTLPSTVPAFLWSPQEDGSSNNEVKEAVNYQTLSPKDLAKSVLSEGGWSNLLCSGKETQHPVDVALLFVGREVLDISGTKYVDSSFVDLLEVSDPFRPKRYPYQELQRFLAESTLGNGSVSTTVCDGVCQIKSSLLEGILVGIVLLIILISGLCCMAGIDTPTRFEAPQDS
ncbi:GDP polyribonucleotidyltransferase [Actinidia chinensis var. chinensis]|uniref:GDP polyribonucleotidyltransferase n=1 Tax=Actinidia chinensis var. chinensis TaxID=1590841 RepID=A0A2R6PFY2_ACTCC|nr:GDP polyribonucleotidyltransferase [Actinidia chinensis var. chinensis]